MELLKFLIPTIISFAVLLLQLYISKQIAPVDKKLSVICQSVDDLKKDNQKQWDKIDSIKSDFDLLHGEHLVNHK